MSTRDRLIKSALELLNAGEAISLESVAAAAGISRATAYRSVSGIPDLMASTYVAHAEHHLAELYRQLEGVEHTIDALEVVVIYTAQSLQSDPVLTTLFPGSGMPPHELTDKLAADSVRPIIARGQERGEIRADTDAMDITTWLFDSFARGLMDRRMDPEESSRMFRTFFVPALRPPTASTDPSRHDAAAEHLRSALSLLEGSD